MPQELGTVVVVVLLVVVVVAQLPEVVQASQQLVNDDTQPATRAHRSGVVMRQTPFPPAFWRQHTIVPGWPQVERLEHRRASLAHVVGVPSSISRLTV